MIIYPTGRFLRYLCLLVSLLACGAAQALTEVTVPDASQLSYQTDPSGRVFLRNLNTYSSQALGCCYNYYIDTTTAEGRVLFSILLLDIARSAPLSLFIPDAMAAGPVSFGGSY